MTLTTTQVTIPSSPAPTATMRHSMYHVNELDVPEGAGLLALKFIVTLKLFLSRARKLFMSNQDAPPVITRRMKTKALRCDMSMFQGTRSKAVLEEVILISHSALVTSRPGTPARRTRHKYSSQEIVERPRNYYDEPMYRPSSRARSISRPGACAHYRSSGRSTSRHRLDDLESRYPEIMRREPFYQPRHNGEVYDMKVRHGRSRSRSRFSIDEGGVVVDHHVGTD